MDFFRELQQAISTPFRIAGAAREGIFNPNSTAIPRNPQNFAEGAQNFAFNLTKPIGTARAGLFDFVGMDPKKQRQMPDIQAPDMSRAAQVQNTGNPAQNQRVLEMYKKMMEKLRGSMPRMQL